MMKNRSFSTSEIATTRKEANVCFSTSKIATDYKGANVHFSTSEIAKRYRKSKNEHSRQLSINAISKVETIQHMQNSNKMLYLCSRLKKINHQRYESVK